MKKEEITLYIKQHKLIFIVWILSIIILLIYFNYQINKLNFVEERRIIMTNNFSKSVEKIKPTVVRVLVETSHLELPFTGGEYIKANNKVYSSGTGFIVSNDGYIITANHVIKEAKDKIVILRIVNNKLKEVEAKLVSSNQNADVSLLKIEEENLPFIKLGNYDKFKDGMPIGFIGFPLNFQNQITHQGIISGKGLFRYSSSSDPVNIFTINAFVNQGNSGGPLFSADTGDVIGIINARVNVVSKNLFIKLPPDYSPIMSIGGVDPIRLSVETYNSNLRLIGDVTQVGIGYSTSIEYGKKLLEEAQKK